MPLPLPTPARYHCLAPSCSFDVPLAGGKYGRRGGACDASPLAERGGDAAAGAAGWPFFDQFVAHDLTADRSAPTARADTGRLPNPRAPRIDLECVDGEGPAGAPYRYNRDDPAKLSLGPNDAGQPIDLPRNSQGVALGGDPRNGIHLFMNQFHVALLRTRNGLVDRLREDGVAEGDLFEEARRAACWHYQWIVLHDFLPRLIGEGLAGELLAGGRRWYRPAGESFIPLEFADAAYRYGHSQIRHSYRVRAGTEPVPIFPDLLGFRAVPGSRVVDWGLLFDLPGRSPAQRARKIDGRLAAALIELPVAVTGEVEVEEYHSLAVRDLQRGQGTGLPAGEAVARAMGVDPLSTAETGLGAPGWRGETPLWYYVLKEAEAREGGERLGPVGGRIVGEVLVGIVDLDPTSQRTADPGWRPALRGKFPGQLTLADLFAFAAVGG